ncbi:MAG: radical SAM protein [Ignavibacteria bacterium]|jgi:MoaA/NifB/PqqE/SkfB family radical SAM enzyme
MILNRNTVFLCVTDFCNAKCSFCDFGRTARADFIPKKEIPGLFKNLQRKLKCGYLEITGGEPLTYPYINELISEASENKIITQMMTHGGLLNKERINKLYKAGLNILSVSFDHYKDDVFNNHRGIKGLKKTIEKNLPLIKDAKIISSAGITIAKHNVDELEQIAHYVLDIGFDLLFFSFPITNPESTYKIGLGSPDVIEFSNIKLVEIVDRLIALKKELKNKMVHHKLFLKDIRNFYSGGKQKFYCKSGENTFYVDNKLDVYECMVKDNILGNLNGDVFILKDAQCYLCPLQCHRESSAFYHGLKSLPFSLDLAVKKETWRVLKSKLLWRDR